MLDSRYHYTPVRQAADSPGRPAQAALAFGAAISSQWLKHCTKGHDLSLVLQAAPQQGVGSAGQLTSHGGWQKQALPSWLLWAPWASMASTGCVQLAPPCTEPCCTALHMPGLSGKLLRQT